MDLRELDSYDCQVAESLIILSIQASGVSRRLLFFYESRRTMKILIVDDSKFMRQLIRMNVERLGCSVVGEAADGMEAVEAYKMHSPDLVFMDIIMPQMGGLETIDRLKQVDPNAKIIMCSSMGHATYIQEAILRGALDFIVKPFNPQKIEAVLAKYKR